LANTREKSGKAQPSCPVGIRKDYRLTGEEGSSKLLPKGASGGYRGEEDFSLSGWRSAVIVIWFPTVTSGNPPSPPY